MCISMHGCGVTSQQASTTMPNVVPGPNKYAPYLYPRAPIDPWSFAYAPRPAHRSSLRALKYLKTP